MLTTIIGARLPIVVVLLLGFFSGWHRDFNGDQATTLNRIVMLHALPLLLPVAGGMIGSFFIVLLAARFVFLRDLGTSALQALTIGGPAVPFVGVSVLGYVFGPANESIPVISASLAVNLGQVPVCLILLSAAATRSGDAKAARPSLLSHVIAAVREPIVCAPGTLGMDRRVLMSSSYIRGSDLQRPMLSGRARKTHLPQPWKSALAVLLLGPFVGPTYGISQSAPSTATKPWFSSEAKNFVNNTKSRTEAQPTLDAEKVYSLAELIDIAEQHNPDTRAAWQAAKTQAAELGVAKSALYPAVAGMALAGTNRHGELIGDWTIQTIGVFRPTLNIEYLIFDFGGRSGAIAAAKDNLFAANFAFTDTHRKIIYDVTLTYYRLLDAIGRQDAARANLANARALEKDAADRLDHGLATNPDVLEAIATRAHAEYELADVLGAQEIAQGDLATVLGLAADTVIAVQGMDKIATPTHLAEAADQMIDRAFEQRPDLMERVAHLREAEAELEQAKSVYLPSLSFSSALGKERAYGQQGDLPGSFATVPEYWNVELRLKWTIFDGGRRESEVAEAKARRNRAQAEIDALRDRIEDEVWRAYTSAKTAFRQQEAASAQLLASDQSYTAALRAYDLGVRNLLDVLAAQRALAEARTADVTARTEVLSQVANLAFTTADLLIPPAAHPHP